MDESFQLHERLDADCHLVTDWPLSRVLLMNDASYPWLILVPRLSGLRDMDDLSPSRMVEMGEEIRLVSKAMKDLFKPDKMNVAALGNMVPQLHVHVIARYQNDPAWPGPVWGVQPPRPYEEEALAGTLDALRVALG
jgi:diadenosine tetraphosphate (Ap4A) HIT family hydrolase